MTGSTTMLFSLGEALLFSFKKVLLFSFKKVLLFSFKKTHLNMNNLPDGAHPLSTISR